MSYLIRFVLLPFLCSLTASLLLTWLVRFLARTFKVLDKPGAHKQHERPTPTLGGVAVFLAFALGLACLGPLSMKLKVILLSGGFLVLVGLVDDLRGVNANIKLLCLALATCILYAGGIRLDTGGIQGLAALLATFLWIGLVASAFNGVDNADGAAGGLAAISSLATFFISWYTWQHELAVISLLLCGSSLGFLFFNFPRPKATIFLGDSGSLFLGFCLGIFTVLGEWSDTDWKAAVLAVSLVLVPLFDFGLILVVRGLDGRYKRWDDPIRMCARDHTFHRLRALGLSPRAALGCLYIGGAATGLFSLVGTLRPDWLRVETVAQLIGFLGLLAFLLWRVPLPPGAYGEDDSTSMTSLEVEQTIVRTGR
ncbi:MAG: hypothetical protein AMXMBFR33_46100 [Candidatus Xenobia bacterium]